MLDRTDRSDQKQKRTHTQALDAATLPTLVSAICGRVGAAWEATTFARRATTIALGCLATSRCPVHAVALQPPTIVRALAHIRKRMLVSEGGRCCLEKKVSFSRSPFLPPRRFFLLAVENCFEN